MRLIKLKSSQAKIFFLILSLFSLLILSCYEQTIVFDDNKRSGSIEIDYILHDEFFRILSRMTSRSTLDLKSEIIFSDQKTKILINKYPNLKIIEHQITDLNYGKQVKLKLQFTNLNNLPQELPFSFSPITMNQAKSIKQTLNISFLGNINNVINNFNSLESEQKVYFTSILKLIPFQFVFKPKTSVLSMKGGKIEKSHNTESLIWQATLLDVFLNKGEISIVIKL